jgi:hypothetical protein
MTSKTWEELWWVSFVIFAVWIVSGSLVLYLLTRVDTIVNVQLYDYGLQFSNNWAEPYWASIRLMMVFLSLPMVLSTVVFALGFSMFRKKAPLFNREAKPTEVTAEEKIEAPLEERQPSSEVVNVPETEVEERQGSTNEPTQELTSQPTSELQFKVIQPETIQVEEEARKEPEVVTVSEQSFAVDQQPKEKEETGQGRTCPWCGGAFNRPLVVLDFSSGKARLISTCPLCNHILGEESNPAKSGEYTGP